VIFGHDVLSLSVRLSLAPRVGHTTASSCSAYEGVFEAKRSYEAAVLEGFTGAQRRNLAGFSTPLLDVVARLDVLEVVA
jgi:hypothetical protein